MPNENKRAVPRHHANVRCLEVSRDLMPVIDISTKGVSFIGEGFAVGEQVNIWLVSEEDEKNCVETLSQVVSIHENRVAVLFVNRTEKLESFIISHITDPAFEG